MNNKGRSLHFILLLLFYFFALLPVVLFLINMPQPNALVQQLPNANSTNNWNNREQILNIYSQWQYQQDAYLLYFVIYLVVVSLLVIAVSRRITKPLRDLERQATAMAEGNLGTAIKSPPGSWWSWREANNLAKSLETARLKILHSYQELESQVAERTWDLQVKVHQLSQAEQKIQATNKALADALALNERQRVMLQDILDNMPVGVLITRAVNGDPEFINHHARQLLDFRASGSDYSSRYQIYQSDRSTLYSAGEIPVNASFSVHRGIYKDDLFARRPDGSFMQLYAQSTVIYDKVGQVELAIMIFDDITARKEIERQKSEFVSVASHQLRTPLSGIKWFAELLLDKRVGKLTDKQRSFADNILQSTQRLIVLVNDLLNVSRIESQRVGISPEPLDLLVLLKKLREELTPLWSVRRQTITITATKPVPLISLDPKFMAEAFTNLLSNAIKYSANEAEIKLELELRPPDVMITVSDLGLGIPLQDQSKVFTKFFRADNVVKKETEGTGLGLYVTKRIIEASGGTITFWSQENQGTQFIITLPLAGSPQISGEKRLI
ncbi:MAG: ATP-binding protein [Candidatus Komeilibacteria bacterium]